MLNKYKIFYYTQNYFYLQNIILYSINHFCCRTSPKMSSCVSGLPYAHAKLCKRFIMAELVQRPEVKAAGPCSQHTLCTHNENREIDKANRDLLHNHPGVARMQWSSLLPVVNDHSILKSLNSGKINE